MKGLKSKALALLLVLALAAMPMSAFAAGEEGATIGGDQDAEKYAINVVLPLNLNYYVNRLSYDSGINQITNVDFPMINKSGVPVAVDVTVTTKDKAANVTIVSSLSALQQTDRLADDAKEKKVLFGLLGASSVGEDSIAFDTFDADMVATEGDYFDYAFDEVDATVAGVIAEDTFRQFTMDGDEAGAIIRMVLDAATGGEDAMATQSVLAEDDAGVSSFTFFAALNTFADWAANDLDVKGDYDITALNVTHYEDTEAPKILTGSLNVLPADEDDTTSVAANGSVTLTDVSAGTVPYKILLLGSEEVEAATSVKNLGAPTYDLVANGWWSLDLTDGVIQLLKAPSADVTYEIMVGSNKYTVVVDIA